MKPNVTILDLAKVSGVSKSTISRYLRGESVSDSKADLIEKAITKTGYVRNNYAQLLRTSKSNFIGLIVPDYDNPFFLTIIKRLDKLAYKEGKTLIIRTTNSKYKRELEAIEFVRGFKVEALFLCRSEIPENELLDLNITIPVISIDKKFNHYISVVSNNLNNGYILSNHIFKNTKDNVMFFSRSIESDSVFDRITGYEAVCLEYNKPILSYKYDRVKGVNFEDLKQYVLDHNIEAIIARNDNEAIKIQSYFNDLYYKKQIRRIKVAGFDNIRLSKSIVPRLTTIDQRVVDMCNIAYDKFQHYDKENVKTYVCNSELIVRESTL